MQLNIVSPTSFYKYLSVAAATAVLSNQSLRWASPLTFNDPADMQVDLEIRVDQEAIIKLALDLIWARCIGAAPAAANQVGKTIDAYAQKLASLGESKLKEEFRPGLVNSLEKLPDLVRKFSAEVRPQLSTTKIICFSECKESNLMWSHYAESHAGLVLEFRNAEGCDSVYRLARPVCYSEHPPQFSDAETLAKIIAGDENISYDSIDRMVYTKSEEWAYEKEWRIQSGDGRKPNDLVEYAGFFTEELFGVYFGCRISQGTRNLLLPLIRHRYPRALIWQARRETNSYKLEFELMP